MRPVARHLMIFGRVQGVFYRNWTVETAKTLGLAGWVRNRLDGCVEAWIEGPQDAVEQMIAFAHQGPPSAAVARIDTNEVPTEALSGFEKRPTA